MVPKRFFLIWVGEHLSYLRYLTFKTCRLHHLDADIFLYYSGKYNKDTSNWVREKQDFQTDMGVNYLDKLKDLNIKLIQIEDFDTLAPVYQADLLRWKILESDGGVYLDTDQIILRNFYDLFDCDFFYSSYNLDIYGTFLYFPIGVLGSIRSHWLSQEINKIIMLNLNTDLYQSIGPPFLKAVMGHFHNRVVQDKGMINYPQRYFYPAPLPDIYCQEMYYGAGVNCQNSYAIHWFGGFQLSHEFNSMYTEEFAKKSADTLSTALREMGAL